MVIAAVLCLLAAVAAGGAGLWALSRPAGTEPRQLARRAMAPTQLAAAAMLAAGGVTGFSEHRGALVVLVVCVLGALGTVAAGAWQSARVLVTPPPPPDDCTGSCASCTLSCH